MAWRSVKKITGTLPYLVDPREIGWEDVDWMHLAQDRDKWRALMNTVMNPWVP
jgi:hypothetical protein